MERLTSTLSRLSRVLYLSHRALLYYIGNKKTLDKVDRVDRRCNFLMRPRHGKISFLRTAAVNPLFFDSKRLWIIPPRGTEGVKMLCSWCDVAVLMPQVVLFHFMRKAVVV